MSDTERVPYVVGRSEAEEIIEHQAYNTTERKQVRALTVYETNVWFALRIKKRYIERGRGVAREYCCIQSYDVQNASEFSKSSVFSFEPFSQGVSRIQLTTGVPVLYSTQLKQRLYFFERRNFIDSEIIYN